jgi:hypothetical protein
VIACLVEGFRDGCLEYGIPIEPGDLAYYMKVITAKLREVEAVGADSRSEKLN